MLWPHSCSPEPPQDIYSSLPFTVLLTLGYSCHTYSVRPIYCPSYSHSVLSSILHVCLVSSYRLSALGRNNFPSPSFVYFSDPILGWKHSGHSLLNEKCLNAGKKGYVEKKWRLCGLETQEEQDCPLFPWLAKFNWSMWRFFSPPHVTLLSSNLEIQNVHLVGEEEIIFLPVGIRIKD